jgi:PAP2 superfamily
MLVAPCAAANLMARASFARRLTGALALLTVLASPDSIARADSVHWDPAWSHANEWDYSFTAVAAADVAVYLPLLQSKQPALEWTRPILFDTAVRNLLRGSPTVAANSATASWVMLGAVVAFPFVDVPVAWSRYGQHVAWDLFWEDSTALSLATAVDLNLRDVVGRARPPVSECLMSGASTSRCLGTSEESTRSFPGGHQLIVASAAALTCTQHLKMHLYGDAWDGVVCAVVATSAFTVGVLRVIADDHWASDTLAGDLLGLGFGWGIPTLMHLHGHAPSLTVGGAQLMPVPIAVRAGGGLGVTGLF